jgi:hypothetical protein
MKWSNNNIAEMLVKNLGAHASGAPGSWPTEALSRLWETWSLMRRCFCTSPMTRVGHWKTSFGATVLQSALWLLQRTGSNLRFSPGRLREALLFCVLCLLTQDSCS